MSNHDAVYKPSHYEKDGYPSSQEFVRGMFAGTEGKLPLSVYPWWKDAFKYIVRWPLKHETREKQIEDLNKAKRCIDMVIEELFQDEIRDKIINMSDEEASYYAAYAAINGTDGHQQGKQPIENRS